jgi:hypothetical protein
MLSAIKTKLLTRRILSLILICIIIAVPITVLVHAELSYGGYDQDQYQSVEVYSLKDIWYPRNPDWQPYPLFIKGEVNSYYSRPFLMYPHSVVMEFFFEDITNSSADLSWLGVSDYTLITEGRSVNVTVEPKINGNYGDNEGYIVNESESVSWYGDSLPLIATSVGAGISYRDLDMTGEKVGDRYSICTITLGFGLDTKLQSLDWSILLEIAILLEEASQISGHEMQVSMAYTITWTPILVSVLWWDTSYSELIIRGDSVTDGSVTDYTLFMLEGNIEIDYVF